jgi:hypothetical protein
MLVLQAVGGGAFLIVSSILGIRLLFMAVRNQALPELLLGVAFLCGGTLGALIEANALVLGERGFNAGPLLAAGKTFGLIGMISNCLFTWWVFRRDDRWALGVIGGISLWQLVAFIGHFWSGAFTTAAVQPLWFWIEFIGRLASPTWLGIEAALYWMAMRRRLAIGLGDAIVANRFALWALASASGVVFLFTSVPPLYVTDGLWIALDLTLFALAGISTAAAYWLAFFPPATYARYVEARSA